MSESSHSADPAPDPEDVRLDRMAFYPVVLVGIAFCMTIFVVIAAEFGDPQANNPINRWVLDHSTNILLWETVLLMIVGVMSMFVDRVRTLRRRQSRSRERAPEGGSAEENDRVD